ncbi:MAG: hypothetical protein JXR83_01755 [Deltaproteobacteria bacterium]|nr:hypothetical protein [Deltaproteobacteria bacterium]
MIEDARFAALEKMIAEIHRSVVLIENDHGRKIDLALEGLDAVNRRLDQTNQRIDETNQRIDETNRRVANIETDVHEIKGVLGLLKSIATDHETRLQKIEHAFREHLGSHRHPA